MPGNTLSRRSVLTGAAAGWAAGQVRAVAANDRITMGAIGVGARGTSVLRDFFKHPDAQVEAMCDVNQDNLSRAVHLANERYGNKDCKGYSDFRELLERPD